MYKFLTMSPAKWISALIFTAAVLSGCGHERSIPTSIAHSSDTYEIYGKTYHPIKTDDAVGFHQQGTASWYGKKFHEKKTANGEIYNMYAMTAAHKTLPFGTMVEVRNLENNKTAIVRINDRGPFVRERIIDLSNAAARKIDMIGNGTARVEIIVLGTDDDVIKGVNIDSPANNYFTGDFTVQAGSFADKTNAQQQKLKLKGLAGDVYISSFEKNGITFYRVRVGRFTSLKQAKNKELQLLQNGFSNVFTVAWDL
ncbi:MAG: septal ring lytic transglycosylase RlpA family protein [Dissulfuribacterales bacterium]